MWRYNLHYFDDLCADQAEQRRDWHESLLSRWIEENPLGQGTGWEPYPVSLRIVNWIKAVLAGLEPPRGFEACLATQARWLSTRLEYHLLGNHLFANAKALVFAGCFFDGWEADAWLKKGTAIISNELDEQFLADGAHFELSPMYHVIALEDLLDLLNLSALFPECVAEPTRELLHKKAVGALGWLRIASHPDGRIPFFNDSAFGVAPEISEIARYATDLGVVAPQEKGTHLLPDSGYARLETDNAVALVDVAEVGPTYLPGHAHADTLSFELSVWKQRLVVNSGTSVYGLGPERSRQRGTAAHSTVTVRDENSSEVWAGFRVARRAVPSVLGLHRDGDQTVLTAEHDGYKRLSGSPVHRRQWRLSPSSLTVSDFVSPGHPAVARYHIHPAWTLEGVPGAYILRWRLHEVELRVKAGRLSVVPSSYHPMFGVRVENYVLEVRLQDGRAEVEFVFPETGGR